MKLKLNYYTRKKSKKIRIFICLISFNIISYLFVWVLSYNCVKKKKNWNQKYLKINSCIQ